MHPTSKQGWAGWAAGTTVGKLWGFDPAKITSQFFWDQINRLPADELEALQAELAGRVRRQIGLSTDSLFYDVTNFFTFIDSRNRRCDLPQRGKNKQPRNDLTTFPVALEVIARQCRTLGIEPRQVTLAADKGNISKANWELLDASRIGHVVSLTPGHYPDWAHRPIEDFNECEVPDVGPMKLLCGQAVIAGRQRTVIVLDSPTLRDGQMRGLSQQLGPVMSGLGRLGQSLKEATRRRREDAIRRQISRILAPVPQVRQVLRLIIRCQGRPAGLPQSRRELHDCKRCSSGEGPAGRHRIAPPVRAGKRMYPQQDQGP